MRVPEDGNRYLSCDELAEAGAYVKEMGFTHLELLPVTEHPFDGLLGLSAGRPVRADQPLAPPTRSRASSTAAIRRASASMLDWVPGHFPTDPHGLGHFDGTHLYEHADPRLGFHLDWNTLIYNYGRREVANFLLANALFWLKHTISTACGSMRSPRCSISTTPARPASGFPTSTAAARTSKRSPSCAG